MAFTDLDDLFKGMKSGNYQLPLNRASIANMVAGHDASLWRGTGFPAQGAIPTVAAICSSALTGALPLAARSGGQERVISQIIAQVAAIGHTLHIEDRLGHMGGLSGAVTTAQAVGLDLHANLGTSNLAARIGASDYSEVEWWLEWYADTGATIATPTIDVTFHDGTTGQVNIWVLGATALPATVRASRRYKIVPTNGKYIRAVDTGVTLSANTGGAGNFGVTATRKLCSVTPDVALRQQVFEWSQLNAPLVQDEACITLAQSCITTTTGASAGYIAQAVN